MAERRTDPCRPIACHKIKSEVRVGQSNDAAKPLSDRQLELAERWIDHLREKGGRMPEQMRRDFFELFWEEQLEREREGKPLRIPPGDSADEQFLLGLEMMGWKLDRAAWR